MRATLMCLEPQRITEHDGHVWANPRPSYSITSTLVMGCKRQNWAWSMPTKIEGVPPHNPTGPSMYYGCASSRGISPNRFNTLIRVEGSEENNYPTQWYWIYMSDVGNLVSCMSFYLKSRMTVSCGLLIFIKLSFVG